MKTLWITVLSVYCAITANAQPAQTECVMWSCCNYTITAANSQNYTNRQVNPSYAWPASNWVTNQVPVTLTTYLIKNLDGSLYDIGINVSWKAWPTNADYELQWTTNLASHVWFSWGVGGFWHTNETACYSGPMLSAKCPARFFRVMSGLY